MLKMIKYSNLGLFCEFTGNPGPKMKIWKNWTKNRRKIIEKFGSVAAPKAIGAAVSRGEKKTLSRQKTRKKPKNENLRKHTVV